MKPKLPQISGYILCYEVTKIKDGKPVKSYEFREVPCPLHLEFYLNLNRKGPKPTLAGYKFSYSPLIEELRDGERDGYQRHMPILVRFKSNNGKNYTAVHVFEHPIGPYILLTNKEKDKKDFEFVRKILAAGISGVPENKITDRGNDISSIIKLENGFKPSTLAKYYDNLYSKEFLDTSISLR